MLRKSRLGQKIVFLLKKNSYYKRLAKGNTEPNFIVYSPKWKIFFFLKHIKNKPQIVEKSIKIIQYFTFFSDVTFLLVFFSFQKKPPEVFCKKDVLRSIAKFTGKLLCQSLFFNNVAGLCEISKNTFSYRTLMSKNHKQLSISNYFIQITLKMLWILFTIMWKLSVFVALF